MFNPCPNPITSLLTIESKKNICNAINTARNSIEQEMFKKIYSSTNAIALTLDVAPDLYFIEIIDEGKVSALKVIKE
jgi:hypothetical protein